MLDLARSSRSAASSFRLLFVDELLFILSSDYSLGSPLDIFGRGFYETPIKWCIIYIWYSVCKTVSLYIVPLCSCQVTKCLPGSQLCWDHRTIIGMLTIHTYNVWFAGLHYRHIYLSDYTIDVYTCRTSSSAVVPVQSIYWWTTNVLQTFFLVLTICC